MNRIEQFFVKPYFSIIHTLNVIDENAKGIALVVDEDSKLLGTVTDGDIRRALIRGDDLRSTIDSLYNKDFKYVYEDEKENSNEIMAEYKIRFIPVLNRKGVLVDFIEPDNFQYVNEKKNPVLIMAGGLGTRLRPLTDDIPKPMLKVGDKPILQTIIEQFKAKGYRNILLSVNYKSEIIENYFRDGKDFGVDITYIREDKRLGTGGAIKLAEQYLNMPFFVINGDILTNLNFDKMMALHLKNNFNMTIGARNYEIQIPYGVLNVDKLEVSSLEEKPIVNFLVSGGVYALSPQVLKFIPEDEFYNITDLINVLTKENYTVGSYPIEEYWMDIGKLNDYYQANEDIKKFF
ncbi:alcohol dehydrogenase [Clostridium zeae]|uniref:Alcohol dehydrogenase n=1 Tax=Clostridium zeae TaxID=2759022 RepID=A0ABQ1EFY4_9CLOT|nr:nucleotidyltransferase family protein [Clostridium zeae]GFZ33721.1 alcohol dehydrogenase [Clostridium zeae]